MERIEGLVAEGLAITAAYRTAYAFSDGKALQADYEGWQRRLDRAPTDTLRDGFTDEERADIARMIAAWHRAPVEVS